jgi:type I restriction-modification system DNA methylase subunit
MGAPDKIKKIVETFANNIDSYKSSVFNETQARVQFIDPFFTALGWDVENKSGYAEAYKDVIHEFSLKTKDVIEAPDYCFRIGGTKKFFVEAKRPSIKLDMDISPAYQLRRYAWTAKLPLSILTDFEEFAVYDCRIPPNKNDKPSVSRVTFIHYTDYVDKWEEIESIFSREAVLKGSFDKYVESNKKKKGTAEVDKVFLQQMEEWRKSLAKNIALRNPSLNIHELNYAVQKTLDRIIFLRICEDRGIEDYGQLMTLQNGANVYERLKQIFHRADEKYNSGLFHFEFERGRSEPPDEITLNLAIDDKAIKDVIKELYYPDSPYEFSVLPAEILGNVYEQFLGKVIRLTPSHHAVVEDKPEVKKAGGVYYTPTYIVDYIVKNTVGKILAHPSPSPLVKGRKHVGFSSPSEVVKLKILDPACGSGSFLLGAYQYLLDWHLKYYLKEIETNDKLLKQKQPSIYMNDRGEYLLTTSEKKRILLNNIYGVDIDPQAVEVTKLSLMLKVLEGENTQTLSNTLQFFRERALPDLSNNIKCGNSLIGPDFYDQPVSANPRFDGMEMQFLNDEEKLRINVFDWKKEFPQIFSASHSERSEEPKGFDVVIGNPPYVFGGVYGIEDYEKIYFQRTYKCGKGKVNLFAIFIERSLSLLKHKGLQGFIIPNTILRVTSYKHAREYLLKNYNIREIVDLGTGVFKGATTSSIILIIEQASDNQNEVSVRQNIDGVKKSFDQSMFAKDEYVLNIRTDEKKEKILKKLKRGSFDLGLICKEMIFGVVITKNQNELVFPNNKSGLKPFVEGKDISRYYIKPIGKYLLYEPSKLHRPRTKAIFEVKEKIIIQRITGGKYPLNATYDNKQLYNKESINNIILKRDVGYSIFFILGLINSKLINWFYRTSFTNESKLTVNLSKTYLSKIPVKECVDEEQKRIYDKIVNHSKAMLIFHDKLANTKTPQETATLQRQIAATDNQIDQLVYKLYGLTEEEIKIVEARAFTP